MAVNRSVQSVNEERLYQVLLEYLECSERGLPPDPEELLSRHPEFASELNEFLEAQHQFEDLTAPVRQASQGLFQAARSGWSPSPGVADTATGTVRNAAGRTIGDYEI